MAERFGCDACYGDDADAASLHYGSGVERDVELTDESHFIVWIGHCRMCSQRFVSIFTEDVDWYGGDDAQHRTVVPITADEAAALVERGGSLDLAALGALGEDRRYLEMDWPTGAPDRRTTWSTGKLYVRGV